MAAPTTTISSALAAVLLCAAAFLAADAARGHHHHPKAGEASDLVATTCANVTKRHSRAGPDLTIKFCESALRSDKRSAAASHPRDLALVAMDLVQSGAANAYTKVDGALYSDAAKRSKERALSLRYCRLDYGQVLHGASVCRAMVEDYNPAAVEGHVSGDLLPDTYLECVNRLVYAAYSCFFHIGMYNDMEKGVYKEVDEVVRRANLAKAMVEQMIDAVGDDDDDE